MSAEKTNTELAVSMRDSAVLLCAFSVSGSVFQDAESRNGGMYSFLTDGGRNIGDSACIVLHGAVCTGGMQIRVEASACHLYRVVEEKVTGFVAVVRRSVGMVRKRIRSFCCRVLTWCRRIPPRRSVVLSFAGGLRL